MTTEERAEIEIGLKLGKSLTEIGNEIGKSSNTVKYEIINHRDKNYPSSFNGKRNLCTYYINGSCSIKNLCNIDECNELCKKCRRHHCNEICYEYTEYLCTHLTGKPYCCNGCESVKQCHNIKMFYYARCADTEYHDKLINSRKGYNITKEEIEYINKNVQPRIKNGQSFYNILASDKNIKKSISSLYNYTEGGVFEFKNIDLPKKVQYKKRHKENNKQNYTKEELNAIEKLKETRNYELFIKYSYEHPDYNITEMDTVIGTKTSKKVILTLLFRKTNFMIAILMKDKKASTTNNKLNILKKKLTKEIFMELFKILLTDNGVEFTMIEDIEKIEDKNINLFFCDAGRSNQKGKIEKNHVELRKILPKGTNFDKLTQKDINLAISHVNSYKRKKLDGKSPYEAMVKEYGQEYMDNIMKILKYKVIKDENIILKPKLLKK